MQLFKRRYLEELKKAKETLPLGEAPVVKKIAVKTCGRPLLVGEFDIDIQTYILWFLLLLMHLHHAFNHLNDI